MLREKKRQMYQVLSWNEDKNLSVVSVIRRNRTKQFLRCDVTEVWYLSFERLKLLETMQAFCFVEGIVMFLFSLETI